MTMFLITDIFLSIRSPIKETEARLVEWKETESWQGNLYKCTKASETFVTVRALSWNEVIAVINILRLKVRRNLKNIRLIIYFRIFFLLRFLAYVSRNESYTPCYPDDPGFNTKSLISRENLHPDVLLISLLSKLEMNRLTPWHRAQLYI